MAAIRRIGKYKITVKWQPNRSGYTPWALGLYVLTVRQPESRHNIEREVIHIFDEPAPTGYTPEQLGVDRGLLGKPRAFDAVIRAAVEKWRERYPNRTLYQELEQDINSMRRTA
jgi:hypothetical protein